MLSVCDDAFYPWEPSPSSAPRVSEDMAALSVPNDTAYASQAFARGMILGAPGGHVSARAACRSGATACDHSLADLGHKV
jgi:hypothetical protein